MSNKSRLDEIVSQVGKGATSVLDKSKSILEESKNYVVDALDQNENGKLDWSDFTVYKEEIGNKLKLAKETSEGNAREAERNRLKPIFTKDLESVDFFIPKLVRVTDRDKKYTKSKVCKGSIGCFPEQKGHLVFTVFLDSLDSFNLDFYPDPYCEFYYMDPSDRNRYIALDEYFAYMKIARINELQRIAQDLGARHFKVTYKEEQASLIDKKRAVRLGTKKGANLDQKSTNIKFSTVVIEADMEFPPHEPVKPQLKYMQNDPSIQTLIEMRMNKTAPLISHKYMLNLSTTSGIKESDAVEIDALLKDLKFSGNVTVTSEAQNESRRYLEYEIEF